MSDEVYINSENAQKDQWKLLAQYAYPTNITRYLKQHGLADSEKLVEYIAGCFRQSEAYFIAAETSPIDISPLLQYYGAATVLAGASAMISGAQLPIKEHGMTLNTSNIKRIADAQIIPRGNGALHQFAGMFSPGCSFVNGEPWTMEEIFGSIPDLKQDFESCYQEAVQGLSSQVEKVTPRKILKASNGMNYAFFHTLGTHFNDGFYLRRYDRSAYGKIGKELMLIHQGAENNYKGDVDTVNKWAEALSLSHWFAWRDFEDVPDNYLNTFA